MKTELNHARTHSAKLRKKVDQLGRGLEKEQQKHKKTLKELEELTKSLQHRLCMENGEDDKQIIKTRVQELAEFITQMLEEELSTEKSDIVISTEKIVIVISDLEADDSHTPASLTSGKFAVCVSSNFE